VRRHGRVIAELRHDAGLAHAPSRVTAVARGAAPALEHAAVRARLRAELRELDASRARLIDATDRERRRLERDLHDGAQQRLIALSVAVRDEKARRELLASLAELRDIAHGIHSVALSEAGLDAAIRELADGSRVPLRLVATPPERLPLAVESAAHRLVADAVDWAERDGDGRAVEIEIARSNGLLRASIRVPGVDPHHAAARLEHSADRFTALGGKLSVEPGTVIEGRLPCAS
jgi:signal transduction histidine kinase